MSPCRVDDGVESAVFCARSRRPATNFLSFNIGTPSDESDVVVPLAGVVGIVSAPPSSSPPEARSPDPDDDLSSGAGCGPAVPLGARRPATNFRGDFDPPIVAAPPLGVCTRGAAGTVVGVPPSSPPLSLSEWYGKCELNGVDGLGVGMSAAVAPTFVRVRRASVSIG
eukprot:m.30986 g.30986  ORF g.30986 m.30986 type:complete len:168 (-) comp12272_c1_seq2:1040-1543(-)